VACAVALVRMLIRCTPSGLLVAPALHLTYKPLLQGVWSLQYLYLRCICLYPYVVRSHPVITVIIMIISLSVEINQIIISRSSRN